MHTDRIAAFMVCALLAACGERGPATPADRDADVAAIAGVNERILGALNAGDWARLNELTDASYVAIIGGNPIEGKERLEASNQRFLEQWHDQEQWLPDETIVDGDLAFQRGSFTMTLTPRQGDGARRDLAGTYLHIYQRKADGSWALTRAMAASTNE